MSIALPIIVAIPTDEFASTIVLLMLADKFASPIAQQSQCQSVFSHQYFRRKYAYSLRNSYSYLLANTRYQCRRTTPVAKWSTTRTSTDEYATNGEMPIPNVNSVEWKTENPCTDVVEWQDRKITVSKFWFDFHWPHSEWNPEISDATMHTSMMGAGPTRQRAKV